MRDGCKVYGDVPLITKVLETLVVELMPIVCDNKPRCSKSTYDRFLGKVVDVLPRHASQWLGFNPLSEVVNCY